MVEGDIFVERDGKTKGRRLRSLSDLQLDWIAGRGRPRYEEYSRFPRLIHQRDDEYVQIRATEILEDLSKMIEYKIGSMPSGVRGVSKSIPGPLKRSQEEAFPYGAFCQIRLNRRLYTRLVNLTKASQGGTRRWQVSAQDLLLVQFDFADLLVHEIGHALNSAAQGALSLGEPFHMDEDFAEGGGALENAIFGGRLDGEQGLTVEGYAASHGLCEWAKQRVCQEPTGRANHVLNAWPDPLMLVMAEQVQDVAFRHRGEKTMVTQPQRVPLSFIGRLLSQQFWEQHVHQYGSEPLRIPDVGVCSATVDVQTGQRYPCGANGAEEERLLDMAVRPGGEMQGSGEQQTEVKQSREEEDNEEDDDEVRADTRGMTQWPTFAPAEFVKPLPSLPKVSVARKVRAFGKELRHEYMLLGQDLGIIRR